MANNLNLAKVNEEMKYMRSDLKAEYKRYRNRYPDLEAFQRPLINISDVLRAYFILVDYFSDPTADVEQEKMLVGIRDMNLLISALGRQNASFGGKTKYKEPLDICATLFYGLVKNHAFSDGNKRVSLLTLLYQLDCYGFRPTATQREFERLVLAVAGSELSTSTEYRKLWRHTMAKDKTDKSVEVISRALKQMTKKKDNSFHIDITARDFAHAIQNVPDCSCELDGRKLRLQRTIKRKNWIFQTTSMVKMYTITYRGETRTIGAATVREALEALELYDQFPDYQSFVSGVDPRYMLIQKFEGPLRRLKDK